MPNQPLGPTGLLAQSMTLPAGSQSMAMGGMGLRAQGMDGRKKGVRIFQIAPAVNGKTIWNLDIDGALNLSTQGTWTITPLGSFNVNVKAWGEGGKQDRDGPAGAGAFAGGTLSVVAGEALLAGVGQGRGPGSAFGPSPGGGWVGLLVNASLAALLIAGAGGGGGYNIGIPGGAGGYPSGITGGADGPTDLGGVGATQVGPGAGGVSTSAVNPTNGGNGSGRNGGAGGYAGGGGGGGYFGGGGGAGSDFRGAGGGGGSSYFNPSRVSNPSMLSGSGTTPGNASDPDRNGAGSALSGRLILS